ncbi:MAG: LOG family protein [bacterium]|nr:LOG family protein [bacterium]
MAKSKKTLRDRLKKEIAFPASLSGRQKTSRNTGEVVRLRDGSIYHLKYKICISGAAETGHCAPDALQKTEALGRAIAARNCILITGATTGAPYWAAKGAKEAGGMVIGFSPAASKIAHVKTYHLPIDYHDLIVYTGFDYAGRNLILVRSSDAMITVCGRIGTLNEFTAGFEDKKVQGVLTGTGGMADMLQEIITKSHRGVGKVVFDSDPERLLDKVIALIQGEEKLVR